jgi:hypothetical protein
VECRNNGMMEEGTREEGRMSQADFGVFRKSVRYFVDRQVDALSLLSCSLRTWQPSGPPKRARLKNCACSLNCTFPLD